MKTFIIIIVCLLGYTAALAQTQRDEYGRRITTPKPGQPRTPIYDDRGNRIGTLEQLPTGDYAIRSLNGDRTGTIRTDKRPSK